MLSEREQKAELRGAGLKAVLSATDTGGGGAASAEAWGSQSCVWEVKVGQLACPPWL